MKKIHINRTIFNCIFSKWSKIGNIFFCHLLYVYYSAGEDFFLAPRKSMQLLNIITFFWFNFRMCQCGAFVGLWGRVCLHKPYSSAVLPLAVPGLRFLFSVFCLLLIAVTRRMSDHICLRSALWWPLNKKWSTHTHPRGTTTIIMADDHSNFGAYWSSTFIELNLPDYRYLELNSLWSGLLAIQVALAVVIEFQQCSCIAAFFTEA